MTTPATQSPFAATLQAVKGKLMMRVIPARERAGNAVGDQIDQARQMHDGLKSEIDEIDGLVAELGKLRDRRAIELQESAVTLNTLLQTHADLNRV